MNESVYEYDAYFKCHPDDLVHVGPLYKTLEEVYGYTGKRWKYLNKYYQTFFLSLLECSIGNIQEIYESPRLALFCYLAKEVQK